MIRRNTAILFGIFILLLAGTLIWQRTQSNTEGIEATPTYPEDLLFDLDKESIKAISIQDASGGRVNLARSEDSTWVLIYPKADATDETAVDTALSQFLNSRISARPQAISDLATVGLQPVSFTILIETQDGEQTLVNVGNLTPTESGYYVLTEDRVIYVASKFGMEALLKLLNNPPSLVTPTPSPSPTPELILPTGEQSPSMEATATP